MVVLLSNKKWQYKKKHRGKAAFWMGYGTNTEVKGAYANRFGIGPDVIGILI
jgi:hypothetical protein